MFKPGNLTILILSVISMLLDYIKEWIWNKINHSLEEKLETLAYITYILILSILRDNKQA